MVGFNVLALDLCSVALGIVTLGGGWLVLPETAASRGMAGSGRIFGSYMSLLCFRSLCGYMFGGAFTRTSFYAYLTASPHIFTQMLMGTPLRPLSRERRANRASVDVRSWIAA
jgi:hypothetical protein